MSYEFEVDWSKPMPAWLSVG